MGSVPLLIQDVEDHSIDKGTFTEFIQILDVNLPVLLDLLSQSDFIQELTTEDDNDLALLRKRLIMMMCEHAPILPGLYPPYTSNNHDLWININRICSSSELSTPSLLHECLSTYKDRLLSHKWRRDMGSSHGFVYYCHLYLQSLGGKVDLQTVLFILSIASQFIDCIHGEVKVLGLRLYSIILTQCPSELVLDANVHKVVIKSCLENSQKLLNDDCVLLLWDDVVQAVTLDEKMMADLNWNELDDGLHLLFQRIKLEGKRGMRQKFRKSLMQVIKACFGREMKDLFGGKDLSKVQQEMMRRTTVEMNEKLFRWITDLKELFIFECLSVSNCAESTEEALRVSGARGDGDKDTFKIDSFLYSSSANRIC